MPCHPCHNTGKQSDRNGNMVECPRCRGTGNAIEYQNRFYADKKGEVRENDQSKQKEADGNTGVNDRP